MKVKVGFLPVSCVYFLDNNMLNFEDPNSEYGSKVWRDYQKMLNLLKNIDSNLMMPLGKVI